MPRPISYAVFCLKKKIPTVRLRARHHSLCSAHLFFSSDGDRRALHSFPTRRSSDLLLVRLVVLLPFQLLRLSLATPSRWTPLALSVFLHCVVALLLTLL